MDLHGLHIFLVDMGAEKPSITPKNGILAIFDTFKRTVDYLAPITTAWDTQTGCSRMQTALVHLLASSVWYTDLSCRRGS